MSKTSTLAPRYGSIRDAAAYVGCSERTVRRGIAQGLLPAYRFGPRLLRVNLAELADSMRKVPAVRATV